MTSTVIFLLNKYYICDQEKKKNINYFIYQYLLNYLSRNQIESGVTLKTKKNKQINGHKKWGVWVW